jgi:hypothetical protein
MYTVLYPNEYPHDKNHIVVEDDQIETHLKSGKYRLSPIKQESIDDLKKTRCFIKREA